MCVWAGAWRGGGGILGGGGGGVNSHLGGFGNAFAEYFDFNVPEGGVQCDGHGKFGHCQSSLGKYCSWLPMGFHFMPLWRQIEMTPNGAERGEKTTGLREMTR